MAKKQQVAQGALSDEEIKAEEKFLEGVPRFNIGAFFLAPIWGPAHGFWVAILFYPLWALADNMFYAAYVEGTVLSIVLSIILGIILIVGSIAFSLVGQPFALHRAVGKGVSKETYLKREKIWAVISVIVALAVVATATYYNIIIRPTLGF